MNGNLRRRPVMTDEIDRAAQQLPGAMATFTQLLVDNPAQFALVASGSFVITRAAVSIVRPRTPAQALALFVFLQLAMPKLAMAAVDKGWITFRVRDAEGCLVPLRPEPKIADGISVVWP